MGRRMDDVPPRASKRGKEEARPTNSNSNGTRWKTVNKGRVTATLTQIEELRLAIPAPGSGPGLTTLSATEHGSDSNERALGVIVMNNNRQTLVPLCWIFFLFLRLRGLSRSLGQGAGRNKNSFFGLRVHSVVRVVTD